MPEYKVSVIRANDLGNEPKIKTSFEEDVEEIEELFKECGLDELLEDEDA